MWLFCECGYFSAVAHNEKPDTILLRARFAGDLERLFGKYGKLFPDGVKPEVAHTPSADYAYRAEVPKVTWGAIAGAVALDVDYGNFKNHVHEGHGSLRDKAYMGCWWELRQAQEARK